MTYRAWRGYAYVLRYCQFLTVLHTVQLPRDPSSRHAESASRWKRSDLLSHGEYMGRSAQEETVLHNLRCVQIASCVDTCQRDLVQGAYLRQADLQLHLWVLL